MSILIPISTLSMYSWAEKIRGPETTLHFLYRPRCTEFTDRNPLTKGTVRVTRGRTGVANFQPRRLLPDDRDTLNLNRALEVRIWRNVLFLLLTDWLGATLRFQSCGWSATSNTVTLPGPFVTLPLVWHPIRFCIRTFWEILLVFESLEISRTRQRGRGGYCMRFGVPRLCLFGNLGTSGLGIRFEFVLVLRRTRP
jgi:hypothetical protein